MSRGSMRVAMRENISFLMIVAFCCFYYDNAKVEKKVPCRKGKPLKLHGKSLKPTVSLFLFFHELKALSLLFFHKRNAQVADHDEMSFV